MEGKTAADFLAEIITTLAELRQKIDSIEEQLSCLLSSIEEGPAGEMPANLPDNSDPAEIPETDEVHEAAEDIPEMPVPAGDIPVAMEDIPEIDDLPEDEEAPIMEAPVAEDETPIDIDIELPSAGEEASTEAEEVRVSINEAGERKLARSVGDAASGNPRWRIDRPGSPVRNIISAISLNDRVLFIKTLFGEDPLVFQESISALNSMSTIEEAEAYISDRFPEWKMSSDAVYRFMMAVRRKLG